MLMGDCSVEVVGMNLEKRKLAYYEDVDLCLTGKNC